MKQKKHRGNRVIENEKGFTLAEVMVSFVILILVSQLFFSGIAVAGKMEKRANEYSIAGDLLVDAMKDESKCVSGTLRLKLDEETELCGDGWLYRYESENRIINIEGIRFTHVSEPLLESQSDNVEEAE